jgi:hypothetical protein
MTFDRTSGLILSEKYLPGYNYVNLGQKLAEAIKEEDLGGRFLPMKAWDALKSILAEETKDGVIAIENFNILFEPALRINVRTFILDAIRGRNLILKLEHPIAQDYTYYPFPEDQSYYLDFTEIPLVRR